MTVRSSLPLWSQPIRWCGRWCQLLIRTTKCKWPGTCPRNGMMRPNTRRPALSVLAQGVPGVLSRVSGLFARRAFNIESLTVGPSEVEGLSRMTVVVEAEGDALEQVTKQLNKLVNVIKIVELNPEQSSQSEHILVQVRSDASTRARTSVETGPV